MLKIWRKFILMELTRKFGHSCNIQHVVTLYQGILLTLTQHKERLVVHLIWQYFPIIVTYQISLRLTSPFLWGERTNLLRCSKTPLENPQVSSRSKRLHLEFALGKFVKNTKRILKHLVKLDHRLLWNSTSYLFNQSDKDFTGRYRRLHSSEQNVALLISRRVGLSNTFYFPWIQSCCPYYF